MSVSLVARADYTILFQSYDAFLTNPVFDIDGTTMIAGDVASVSPGASGFVGRLFVAPVGGTLAAIGTGSTPFATLASGAAGFVDGATIPVTDAVLNAGDAADYRFRVWTSLVNGNPVSSFAQALATPGAVVGESALTRITALGGTVPGVGGGPGTGVAATANLHSGFTLSVVPAAVPEPSVLALGLLGGAALLLRRRK